MRRSLSVVLIFVIFLSASPLLAAVCGDVNDDNAVNILDIIFLIDYKFKEGPAPAYPGLADVNYDGLINILDIIYLIDFKFKGGPEPDCGPVTGTVTDIDGNIYQTIKIGNQWWMAENLKVTHYRNGEAIPNITDGGTWASINTGAYSNYLNDINTGAIYGRLYNWFAVGDSRNIAPTGWHVASDAEWQTLVDYLGGDADAGGKLKEIGTVHWSSPNSGATNESGFTALPGGSRHYGVGSFFGIGLYAYFWSATVQSDGAWYLSLYYNLLSVGHGSMYKQYGCSVRCVKDE